MSKNINIKVEQLTDMANELQNIVGELKELGDKNVTININVACTVDPLVNSHDLANTLGFKSNAGIRSRHEAGLFNTPEGYIEPCFYLSGNNDAPIYKMNLALKYYEINKRNVMLNS